MPPRPPTSKLRTAEVTMTDGNPTTAGGSLAERAGQRTLRERRRRVWRNVALMVVVTIGMVVLTLLNRDAQALRSCRDHMEYAVGVFQERHDKDEPPLSLLPLPEQAGRGDPAERQLLAWRDHTHYNALYFARAGISREVGVCCCLHPHSRFFQPAGRYVVVLDAARGKYELRWMNEDEFRRRAGDLGLRVPDAP